MKLPKIASFNLLGKPSIVFFITALALSTSGQEDRELEFRTWTDSTGKFKIEAAFVMFRDGKVHLKRRDGSIIAVPSSRLSADDQAFYRKVLRDRRTAGDTTPSVPGGAAAAVGNTSARWSQWRGPNRDGISTETGLLDSWPADGPPLLWSARGLGAGYSSVAIWNGKIYTLGKKDGQTLLVCVSEKDGTPLWSTPLGGGDNPNCTPTVDPDSRLVFGLSHGGDLLCAEAESGREVWRKNFGRDFGGRMMSGWGYSESPLVDGDRLICTPGGDRAVVVALDKRTGEGIWTAAMPDCGGAGYASPVISHGGGVKQYITLVGRGLISVAAENGQLLWHYPRIANSTANIPTSVVKGNYVFCSTGYGDGGSALLQLARRPGGVAFREVYYKSNDELQNHHGGMVLIGDHLFLGHGHNNGFPVCLELLTGGVKWGPQRGPGRNSAAVIAADGDLYFRYEDGTMALIEANPRECKVKGTFRIASVNGKSWPHPAIAEKKLYLRDQDELHCYNIAAP